MKFRSTALVISLLASSAYAQFSDIAQVVSATPIYERVSTPRQECWTELVSAPAYVTTQSARYVEPVQHGSSAQASSGTTGAGAILGAIVGGVVGRQFGNSTGGKDRGTVAGAVIGGLVGNAIESSSNTAMAAQAPVYSRDVQPSLHSPSAETRTVERCRTINESRERVAGYHVTYRYGNQEFTTRMSSDPGPTLRVRVTVTPEFTR